MKVNTDTPIVLPDPVDSFENCTVIGNLDDMIGLQGLHQQMNNWEPPLRFRQIKTDIELVQQKQFDNQLKMMIEDTKDWKANTLSRTPDNAGVAANWLIGYEMVVRVCNTISQENDKTPIRILRLSRRLFLSFIETPLFNLSQVRGFIDNALRKFGKRDLIQVHKQCISVYNNSASTPQERKIMTEIVKMTLVEYNLRK